LVVGDPAGLSNRDSWRKSRLVADGFAVTVVDDSGITGTVTTSSSAVTTGWGKPTSAATVAAAVPSDLSKAAIFGYDTGTVMASGSAPARRVGWWQYESSTSGFTKESKALFDAAVAWASGVTPTVSYSRDGASRIVQRSVNGDVAARYSYTGSGDTSELTLDSTGTVIEATLTMAGGAVFTWRNTAGVWSFPNLHGDIAAVTDAVGVKQGPTRGYAPFGQPLTGNSTGELDNSAGQFDYGWHGAAQRPAEHQSGTHALIEMGARPYDPTTGRFLQVDPIEGGTDNDYVYVNDPINQTDLDGHRRRRRRGTPTPRVHDRVSSIVSFRGIGGSGRTWCREVPGAGSVCHHQYTVEYTVRMVRTTSGRGSTSNIQFFQQKIRVTAHMLTIEVNLSPPNRGNADPYYPGPALPLERRWCSSTPVRGSQTGWSSSANAMYSSASVNLCSRAQQWIA
jgi:RHS repeat-associated protein